MFKIKDWSPDDRPREKLLRKGKGVLSDAELIAVLIHAGTRTESAVDIAKKILQMTDNNLNDLATLTATDLMKVNGIGEAKSVSIVVALELGRRRKNQEVNARPKIKSSRDAFNQINGELMDLPHEEFWVLLLNRANLVTRKKRISEGGVSGTIVDPKIIFKMAIEELSSGIIVAHNHPSGNLTASPNDLELTRKLKDAGKFLDIQLLDHLIIAGKKYYSFADEGLI